MKWPFVCDDSSAVERPLAANESVLFIDRKERQYLKRLRAGAKIHLQDGTLDCDSVIGIADGSRVRNSSNQTYLVLRPTYAQLIPNLPRKAQVIYPKDAALILVWGDVFPGATVVEAGVGPGALTMALLRGVGPTGRLVSIEAREDFAKMAAENVARFHGEAPNWSLRIGDVYDSIPETGVDRVILDVTEPWRAIDNVAGALVSGGVFVGYVPTVLQMKNLMDALAAHPEFAAVEAFESLVRGWHSRELSIRPEHRMVAHTGFLVVARRRGRANDGLADTVPLY